MQQNTKFTSLNFESHSPLNFLKQLKKEKAIKTNKEANKKVKPGKGKENVHLL